MHRRSSTCLRDEHCIRNHGVLWIACQALANSSYNFVNVDPGDFGKPLTVSRRWATANIYDLHCREPTALWCKGSRAPLEPLRNKIWLAKWFGLTAA
jgi:hypothetical protein